MGFKPAEDRLFKNVWVCMHCGAKNRASEGKKPSKCRKCNFARFRLKNTRRKVAA